MEIRSVHAADEPAVERFVARIPEGDRTFFKEDVNGTDVVAFWQRRGGVTTIAVDEGEVIGYGAVIPLQGWSSHVGEVRVIVDPGDARPRRRAGTRPGSDPLVARTRAHEARRRGDGRPGGDDRDVPRSRL